MTSSAESCLNMLDIEITVNGVEKLLKSQNPHKTAVPDEISPQILKTLAAEVAPILTSIYQQILG